MDTSIIPNYICEACQVRAIIQREIQRTPQDIQLLMLERMRQLDILHSWAEGTMKVYASKIRRIQRFEDSFRVPVLRRTVLNSPPNDAAIPLMWAQLHHSLDPGKGKDGHITFATARTMRSAGSLFYQMDAQIAHPGKTIREQKTVRFVPQAIPTDAMVYSLQSGGMARRMGDKSNPSWALQFRHISFINDQLELAYNAAPTDAAKHEIAAAGTGNLLLWFGMLRGGECFNLKTDSVQVIPPSQGPRHGLSPGVGFVDIRLLEETKTSPHKVADIVIAYRSYSGLSLGHWMRRLRQHTPCDGQHLFSTPRKKVWTTTYFRNEYAYPLLELMRLLGEPTLQAFSDQEGHRIRDKVWSCHSWRRGFNSFVKRKRDENFRAAGKHEVDNHARWQAKRTGTMQFHYDGDADLEARLFITSLCS